MTQEMKLSTQEQLVAEAMASRSLIRRRSLMDEQAPPQNVANLLCTAGARALTLLAKHDEVSDHLAANIIESVAMSDHIMVQLKEAKEKNLALEQELETRIRHAEREDASQKWPEPIINPDDIEAQQEVSADVLEAGEYLNAVAHGEEKPESFDEIKESGPYLEAAALTEMTKNPNNKE